MKVSGVSVSDTDTDTTPDESAASGSRECEGKLHSHSSVTSTMRRGGVAGQTRVGSKVVAGTLKMQITYVRGHSSRSRDVNAAQRGNRSPP